MRIGVMLRHLQEKGGIVTYTQNLLKHLIPLYPRHHFDLFYKSPDLLGSYAGPANVSEHVLEAPDKFRWDHWAVPRAADRLGVEVIVNPKLSVPLWGKAAKVLTLRPEQFVHPELFKPLDRLYFKTFMPIYCRLASRILVPAQKAADDVAQYIKGADPRKIVWVHEGCGDHFFAPAPGPDKLEEIRQRYGLPQRFVLFVGGINPLKNLERLVEAYGQVRQERNIPLVVVGFNRWGFESGLSFAKSHPASPHIVFPGFVPDEDMPHIYRLATVLFMPSIYEGFGIPVTEAFATGCPVVTSTTGSSPEVAGGAALLVNPFDVQDMAQGLARVLDDQNLRQELIARGSALAPHYQFERCARQTMEMMENILVNPAPGGQDAPRP